MMIMMIYLMVVTTSGCFLSMRGARANSLSSSRAEMQFSGMGLSMCREVFTAMSRSTNFCSIFSHLSLFFLNK